MIRRGHRIHHLRYGWHNPFPAETLPFQLPLAQAFLSVVSAPQTLASLKWILLLAPEHRCPGSTHDAGVWLIDRRANESQPRLSGHWVSLHVFFDWGLMFYSFIIRNITKLHINRPSHTVHPVTETQMPGSLVVHWMISSECPPFSSCDRTVHSWLETPACHRTYSGSQHSVEMKSVITLQKFCCCCLETHSYYVPCAGFELLLFLARLPRAGIQECAPNLTPSRKVKSYHTVSACFPKVSLYRGYFFSWGTENRHD